MQSADSTSPPSAVAVTDNAIILLPSDQAALFFAESVLTSHCMQAQGFPYQVLDYQVLVRWMQSTADDSQRTQFPYEAAIEGLPYATGSEANPGDPNASHIRSLDEAGQVAYGDALQGHIQNRIEVTVLGSAAGTTRDGCMSEARTSLYGSLEGALYSMFLTGNLAPVAHARMKSVPLVVDAMSKWNSCMAAEGYDFAGFGEARASAAAGLGEADRIAQADDSCTQDSDLASIYASEFQLAQEAIIEGNAEQFAMMQEVRANAIRSAQELLAEG